jgi:hypothetical protein
MGQCPRVGDVIDGRDLDARRFVGRAQKISSDPAETVYRYFETHFEPPMQKT